MTWSTLSVSSGCSIQLNITLSWGEHVCVCECVCVGRHTQEEEEEEASLLKTHHSICTKHEKESTPIYVYLPWMKGFEGPPSPPKSKTWGNIYLNVYLGMDEGLGRGLLSHPSSKNVRKDELGWDRRPLLYTTYIPTIPYHTIPYHTIPHLTTQHHNHTVFYHVPEIHGCIQKSMGFCCDVFSAYTYITIITVYCSHTYTSRYAYIIYTHTPAQARHTPSEIPIHILAHAYSFIY